MADPVQAFASVEGSMSSDNGKRFHLHVTREDGSHITLTFPHREIPNIIECAAMQIANGMEDGKPVVTAFRTSGFQVGHGPQGEIVLNMQVGKTGKIGFLISPEMKVEMIAMLGRSETKH